MYFQLLGGKRFCEHFTFLPFAGFSFGWVSDARTRPHGVIFVKCCCKGVFGVSCRSQTHFLLERKTFPRDSRWEGCVGWERHRWAGNCSSLSAFLTHFLHFCSLVWTFGGFGFTYLQILHGLLDLQGSEQREWRCKLPKSSCEWK